MGRVGESEAESRVVMRGSITEPWRWMESGGSAKFGLASLSRKLFHNRPIMIRIC